MCKTDNTNEESKKQLFYINACKQYVDSLEKQLGRKLTACVKTFGCQMNFHDSEKLLGILCEIGYVETEDEKADLVIYNTCTVRENANLKVYGRLGYLKKIKEKNPNMIIAICGCMMQEKDEVEKIKKSYRFVDILFGTHNIFKFAEYLYQNLSNSEKIYDVWEDTTMIVEDLPNKRKYSFKSGVNIMYGCNNFCSYCIVPYVRGRERSRRPQDIIREIEQLSKQGVVEIMLLGQNVNSYGKTFDEEYDFSDLLKDVEKVEGIKRIRFMTSHPKDLSDKLIDTLANSKKICKQMHLPLQSGSSRLLKIMNRHYTKEDYLELVSKLKNKVPDISITTDIMVGFPGETEEDFNETLDVVRKVEYDSAFTFIYSRRTGTPAAEMENQVPEDVVKKRFDRLLAEISAISAKKNDYYLGKTVEILVEEKNTKDSEMLTGRMDNNLLVHFKGDESLLGNLVKVKLDESKGFYFIGTMEE